MRHLFFPPRFQPSDVTCSGMRRRSRLVGCRRGLSETNLTRLALGIGLVAPIFEIPRHERLIARVPTSTSDVAHLLRRAGFGGSKSDIAALSGLDLAALVEHVLDDSSAPVDSPPIEFSNPNVSGWDKYVGLVHWWYDRMATSSTPLVEKMTLFWHGHFTSSHATVNNTVWMYDQNALFRRRAMGNVRLLAQEMAIQPAMLTYLDNRWNTKRGAQQNFARELMELFTMGIGNYSEADVVDVARAWTGHTVNGTTGLYEFRASNHDTGAKTIFGTTKNWDGPQVIDEIFTNAITSDVVARFLVTKLWTFFAYPNPTPTLVTSLATAFESANFDVKSLLRAMFLRPEFFSSSAKQALVRTPTEFVVAVLRGTGLVAADLHPEWFSDGMGQELFDPPNVAGWKNNSYWLTTNALSARADLAENAHWKLSNLKRHPLEMKTALTPAALVDLASDLVDVDFSVGTRAVLTDFVVRTRAGVNGWTEPQLLVLALLAPEFHVS